LNSLSVSEHIHSVIRSCYQTLHYLADFTRAWYAHRRATGSLYMELVMLRLYIVPRGDSPGQRTDSTCMVLYGITCAKTTVPQI